LVGCAPATSIQDLGWEQQTTINTPSQQSEINQNIQTNTNNIEKPFYASFGASSVEQKPIINAVAVNPQKVRVALLVPLSGPRASIGKAMANAAQLAVFDMGFNNFELLPRDTKGTPQGAMRAARDALASGSQLIIGPLFSASVSAVKPIILASNINMLGLSTDMSLAEPRSYMMGFAPEPQIERVVSYAIKHGISRFGAMIPAGPYGLLVRKEFKKAVEKFGGVIVVEDLRGDVAPIVALKDQIDGLFIPYGGSSLRKIVKRLSEAGLKSEDVQLLGTGLWDAPNIAGNQDLLIDGWYAAPEPELHEHFVDGYVSSFGGQPPRLVTLAYDATAMAVVLARNGLDYNQEDLELKTGFAGVDGLFRLLHNGRIERGLAINKITYDGSEVIDTSPKTFVKR